VCAAVMARCQVRERSSSSQSDQVALDACPHGWLQVLRGDQLHTATDDGFQVRLRPAQPEQAQVGRQVREQVYIAAVPIMCPLPDAAAAGLMSNGLLPEQDQTEWRIEWQTAPARACRGLAGAGLCSCSGWSSALPAVLEPARGPW
jgi:hypothetical protein